MVRRIRLDGCPDRRANAPAPKPGRSTTGLPKASTSIQSRRCSSSLTNAFERASIEVEALGRPVVRRIRLDGCPDRRANARSQARQKHNGAGGRVEKFPGSMSSRRGAAPNLLELGKAIREGNSVAKNFTVIDTTSTPSLLAPPPTLGERAGSSGPAFMPISWSPTRRALRRCCGFVRPPITSPPTTKRSAATASRSGRKAVSASIPC